MMTNGLLIIEQEGSCYCVRVKGEGLHMDSVIESPWFDDMPLRKFFSELEHGFSVRVDECVLYYCESFVELEASIDTLVTLKKKETEL